MELDYVKLKDIKPALSGYIRNSQALLKKAAVPDEKSIHDLRVLMKKSRAVLRLAGPQLADDSYLRDISSFREVGRIMSSWRETSVTRKILKDLRKEFPDIFSQLTGNEKLGSLMFKPEPAPEPSAEMMVGLEKIDALLNKAGYRIRFQTMNKLDPQILLKELENTYNKVINVYLLCRNNPKPDSFHEFRKRVKDFLYQLYFFRPLNPSVIKVLEKNLNAIADNLGKFNDITQLIRLLGYKYKPDIKQQGMDELIIKLRERQDRYLSKTWPIAYKIFCPGQNIVNLLGFKLLVI